MDLEMNDYEYDGVKRVGYQILGTFGNLYE